MLYAHSSSWLEPAQTGSNQIDLVSAHDSIRNSVANPHSKLWCTEVREIFRKETLYV